MLGDSRDIPVCLEVTLFPTPRNHTSNPPKGVLFQDLHGFVTWMCWSGLSWIILTESNLHRSSEFYLYVAFFSPTLSPVNLGHLPVPDSQLWLLNSSSGLGLETLQEVHWGNAEAHLICVSRLRDHWLSLPDIQRVQTMVSHIFPMFDCLKEGKFSLCYFILAKSRSSLNWILLRTCGAYDLEFSITIFYTHFLGLVEVR